MPITTPKDERVGLVLSGGGARGAYEAGALAELLPALERAGKRPTLLVGTSVGAINAAYFAASTNLDAQSAVASGLNYWREVNKGLVVRSILTRQVPLTVLRYAGELLSVPGVRLESLLDPKPLQESLDRWIDWDSLHQNIEAGLLEGLAVNTTAARSGRTVAFVEGRLGGAEQRYSHVIDYVGTELAAEHLRASAAIPFLFPPVRIETPASARGWYLDGGTRLNTPIKPALDLGATRLIVIGTQSLCPFSTRDGRYEGESPDMGVAGLHMLHGALVDPLIEDMRILGNINQFFAGSGQAPGLVDYRRIRGKPPYRKVPYIFVAPERAGAIGELATEAFQKRYGGVRALRSPDLALLNRLLGRENDTHGELLSYLLFDREFIESLIDLGRADALRWLDESQTGDGLRWQLGPLDAFTMQSATPLSQAEELDSLQQASGLG